MIELAETYLGNITENSSLSQRIEKALSDENCLKVYLNHTDSGKGRIHTHTTCGKEIGIVKSRDWSLQEGDVFETQQGKLLLVHLEQQKLMVIRFNLPVNHPINLVHLGHVLGNHHWPIIVQNDKLYVHLAADEEVIEKTIRNFSIPGLEISYEWRRSGDKLVFCENKDHHH
ncbi:urease accessory protein UreE [Gloeothece verrucosa]|nr:urease accessory protein UreE [Gloeothece verrucosa]